MKKKVAAILFSLIAIILLCVVGTKFLGKNSKNEPNNAWVTNNIGESEVNKEVIIFNEKESKDFYKNISSVNTNDKGNIIVKFNKDIPKKVQKLEENTKVMLKGDSNHDVFSNGYAGNITQIDNDNKQITFEQVNIAEIFDSININTENGDGTLEVLAIAVGDSIIDPRTGKARSISGSASGGDFSVSYEDDEFSLSKGDDFEVSFSKGKTNSGKEYFKKLHFKLSEDLKDDKDDSEDNKSKDNDDKEKKYDISIDGSVTLEDLFMDLNFNFKHNIIPKVEFKLATDVTKETNITAGANADYSKEVRLGYVLLGAGGVTVGTGDYNQPVSIGLAITMDLNGEVNVSAELNFTNEFYGEVVVCNQNLESNHNFVKGKTYPHLYLSEVSGDKNDINPSSSLKITGKASGQIEEAAIGVKTMASFMNFDLIAVKLNGGVSASAEGEIEYNILGNSKNENNEYEDGPLNIEYALNVDAIANLRAYSELKILDSKDNLFTLNTELFRKNLISIESKIPKVEFDRNIVDYLNLNIIDEKSVDMNNDEIKDRVVLYGSGEEPPFRLDERTVLVIFDGETQEALTSFEVFAGFKIGEIMDITGDDVKDIMIEGHNGAKRGSFASPFIYKDGGYIEAEESNYYDYKVTLLPDFNAKASIPELNLESNVRLSDSMIEYYKEFNIYNEDGIIKAANKDLDIIGGIKGEYRDVDNDGIGEYISFKNYWHNDTAYGYMPVLVETIFKYNANSGKFDVYKINAFNDTYIAKKLGYE